MFNDKQNYSKEKFAKIHQNKIKFSDIEFSDCTFIDCNFMECEFYNCSFTNCTFSNCDLSLLKVTNSRFVDVSFKQSKAIGIDWTKAGGVSSRMPLSIHFFDSVINYSSFFGLSLHNMQIIHCSVHDVDFTEAKLNNAHLQKSDFFNSRFLHTDLTKADFVDAINYLIDPTANIVKKAKFSVPEVMSLLRGFEIIVE